jgi:hypothetical protein
MTENRAFSRIEAAAVSPVQILKLVMGALGATAVIGLTIEAIQSAAEYGLSDDRSRFHGRWRRAR